jgi:hypothetical protein
VPSDVNLVNINNGGNMNKTNKELEELFKNTSFECYQYSDFDNADDLIDSLRDQISEDEVIYYSNAIKYLSENDASLQESMRLADELGYETKNLNSELLATLLQQENLSQELSDLENEIRQIFDNTEELND